MRVYSVSLDQNKTRLSKKERNEYTNCWHKHLQAQFYTQNSHTLLRNSRINQLEACLLIQMRYGSTRFQKNQPSKSKKVVKPHQLYHSKKIRLRAASNVKRKSVKQCIYATQLWSVPSFFHTPKLQWALFHCLKHIEQEGRFGCWLCWYIVCSRMSMNVSDDTRLETCRAILFLIMTTEWHILIRCFRK